METNFYGVLVSDTSFHGQEALTYKTTDRLEPGNLVMVPLKDEQVIGVVYQKSRKPPFAVKYIQTVLPHSRLPYASLSLLSWMKDYYPAPLGMITQLFLPFTPPKDIANYPQRVPDTPTDNMPVLTEDQKYAIETIGTKSGLHILHGETGTGKTRVYIELAKKHLKNGRSAIILSPEIGLTSQLVRNFKASFGERVVLIHSQLPLKERRKTWFKILQDKQPRIVIGPRSALFAPLGKIGLIVLDESHDTSYKQDRAPYYHAPYVAAKLAQISDATLILGSATPSVSDYLIAKLKKRPVVRMTKLASNHASSYTTEVIDLKDRKNLSKSQFISDTLIDHIHTSLERHEQTLLFLNRRGTARVIFCEKCGWRAACSNCDLPLVYHGDSHSMICHSCGRRSASPTGCPKCSNTSIVFKSAGTKAIAKEIEKLFPYAKIQRFDTDNKSDEKLEKHLELLHRGNTDIIIGTQALAKGIDLPRLSLVGVILADSSLNFPDFSSQERTYQLLHQILGRVGRGHRDSHAIIQTFVPESPIIKAAISKNWEKFYKKESTERQTFHFPPYYHLLKLACKRASLPSAEKASKGLADKLKKEYPEVIVEGPAPCFYEKSQGKYQWQIIVKSKKRNNLVSIIKSLPAGWSYDIDPLNLL